MSPLFPVVDLLNWFSENHRPLPWRVDRTPYRVWIAEIMLQQTQVNTVVPYYQNWMKTYPELKNLAQANEDELIYLWQGLGYYNRVKNILKTAQLIMVNHGGNFPCEPNQLLKLPGIGPYTVGAIRSLAFDQAAAIVDGNIQRLFTRFYFLPPTQTRDEKTFWELSHRLIEQAGPIINRSRKYSFGMLNESLIELGAMVCLVRPECSFCPLKKSCLAFQKSQTHILPFKSKTKIEKKQSALFVISQEKKFLLTRRNNPQLLKGLKNLWEFPILEHHPNHTTKKHHPPKEAKHLGSLFSSKYNLSIEEFREVKKFTHRYTKYQARITVYQARLKNHRSRLKKLPTHWWVSLEEMDLVGFSKANQVVKDFLITQENG